MKKLLEMRHRNPSLLAMELEERLNFKNTVGIVSQLLKEKVLFPNFLSFLILLEKAISMTNFSDKDLAPSLLRRLAWSSLENIARKAYFSRNYSILDMELDGIQADQLISFLGSIPDIIAVEELGSITTNIDLRIKPYLEVALRYRFGISGLFFNEAKGKGEVHYLWVIPHEGTEIKHNFNVSST